MTTNLRVLTLFLNRTVTVILTPADTQTKVCYGDTKISHDLSLSDANSQLPIQVTDYWITLNNASNIRCPTGLELGLGIGLKLATEMANNDNSPTSLQNRW